MKILLSIIALILVLFLLSAFRISDNISRMEEDNEENSNF